MCLMREHATCIIITSMKRLQMSVESKVDMLKSSCKLVYDGKIIYENKAKPTI